MHKGCVSLSPLVSKYLPWNYIVDKDYWHCICFDIYFFTLFYSKRMTVSILLQFVITVEFFEWQWFSISKYKQIKCKICIITSRSKLWLGKLKAKLLCIGSCSAFQWQFSLHFYNQNKINSENNSKWGHLNKILYTDFM